MNTNRISEITESQKNWNRETLLLFCNHISFATTVCVRDIWASETLSDADKISGMKQFNELQHYVMQYVKQVTILQDDNIFSDFTTSAIEILQQNKITNGYTVYHFQSI